MSCIFVFCDKLVELDGGGSVINKPYLVKLFLYNLVEMPVKGLLSAGPTPSSNLVH